MLHAVHYTITRQSTRLRPYIYDYEYCTIIVCFNGNIRILRAKSIYVVYLRNYTITRISHIQVTLVITDGPGYTFRARKPSNGRRMSGRPVDYRCVSYLEIFQKKTQELQKNIITSRILMCLSSARHYCVCLVHLYSMICCYGQDSFYFCIC